MRLSICYCATPCFQRKQPFDALKFVLVGGRGDSVVLEDSKEEKSDYAGLVTVQGRRRAVILVASGIDTLARLITGTPEKYCRTPAFPFTSSARETFSLRSMAIDSRRPMA